MASGRSLGRACPPAPRLMQRRDASLRALADIGEGVMLTPVRDCFGALFRRHSWPPSPVRGADRGGLRRSFAGGRRCGPGGVRAASSQGRRLSRFASGAGVALRGGASVGQQSPSGDAQGSGARAGLGSGRGDGPGPARRCSQHAGPPRAGGGASRSHGRICVLDGAARGQGSGRGCGRAGAEGQHDALARAAGADAASACPDGGALGARSRFCTDGDDVRGGVGRGGGRA